MADLTTQKLNYTVRKTIRLSQEQLNNWDNEGVRQFLEMKSAVSDMNQVYVGQLENIIRNLILSGVNEEEEQIIDNIIGTSEEIR